MQPYGNLPSRQLPVVRLLADDHHDRSLAVPQLSAQNKICLRWQRGKRKIRAVWTVSRFILY